MKTLLNFIEEQGGIFTLMVEIGLGLFVLISLVKCAAE